MINNRKFVIIKKGMNKREFNGTIELSNGGQLSVFYVGTGTAFSKKYFNTNLLVVKGKSHILVDCGSLCPFILETKYQTQITDIKNLFITHPHADHIGGVEEMILADRYIKHSKINLVITDKFKKKLWNESLRGGCQYSESGKMVFEDYFNQIKPKLITKNPFEIYETNVGEINLKIFRTRHITTCNSLKNSQISFGLVIDNRILVTGDTQLNKPQLEELLDRFNIEYIFHDCDISGTSSAVHATYSSLKELDDEIKRKMFLVHYDSRKESVDCVADGFAGFVQSGIYYDF